GIPSVDIPYHFRTADLEIPHPSRSHIGIELRAERVDGPSGRPLWRSETVNVTQIHHLPRVLRLHWDHQAEPQYQEGNQHAIPCRCPLSPGGLSASGNTRLP